MKRSVVLSVAAVMLTTGAFSAIQLQRDTSVVGRGEIANPAHFAPSDVRLVGASNRPQVVEFFHYG